MTCMLLFSGGAGSFDVWTSADVPLSAAERECHAQRKLSRICWVSDQPPPLGVSRGGEIQAVVKVRGNPGECRSWAPKNCGRAFPGPTQPLMV